MNELITFLNALPRAEQDAFAKRCCTSVGYLRKAASVGQLLGAELCVSIETETQGAVRRQDLRPDDWSRIWPELIGQDQTQAEGQG